MPKFRTIASGKLCAGDILSDGVMITGAWIDDDGVWVDTEDGQGGYLTASPTTKVHIF